MNDKAFNDLMKHEVGFWFNPELEDTKAGDVTTAFGRKRTGYVNDPKDRGGETKFGISKKANPDVDIKTMTMEQAKQIYHDRYWTPGGCEDMPEAMAQFHFDTCVLHGVATARKLYDPDLNVYAQNRRDKYKAIVAANPSQARFLNGWNNRVDNLLKELT